MYICLCNQISDKQIQEIMDQNPNIKLSDITKKLGLGSDCGSCLQEFVKHSRNAHTHTHKSDQTMVKTIKPKK